MLKFKRDVRISDGYGHIDTRLKNISKDKLLQAVKELVSQGHGWPHYFTVSTRNGLFGKTTIPVLDCDSVAEMAVARHYLNKMALNSAIIESTPERYWIIVDTLQTIRQALNFITTVPGIDAEYSEMCVARRSLVLRALPKKMTTPNFVDEEIESLKNPIVKKWVLEFKHWFESQMMKDLLQTYALGHSIKDGTAIETISDPDFAIN